jgi:hypothetical protein
MHCWYLVGYFMPYNILVVKADTFPKLPSYMRAGICGAGTDYACPSEYVPVPSKTSLHIGPDDPRLPQRVRERQRPEHALSTQGRRWHHRASNNVRQLWMPWSRT